MIANEDQHNFDVHCSFSSVKQIKHSTLLCGLSPCNLAAVLMLSTASLACVRSGTQESCVEKTSMSASRIHASKAAVEMQSVHSTVCAMPAGPGLCVTPSLITARESGKTSRFKKHSPLGEVPNLFKHFSTWTVFQLVLTFPTNLLMISPNKIVNPGWLLPRPIDCVHVSDKVHLWLTIACKLTNRFWWNFRKIKRPHS